MLRITAEQLTAMRDVPREAYHERMFHLARTAFADFVGSLDDDALRARIREDHAAAERLGVRSLRGATYFLGLSLLGGERRFYETPELVDYLDPNDPESEEKLELVFLCLRTYVAQERAAGR